MKKIIIIILITALLLISGCTFSQIKEKIMPGKIISGTTGKSQFIGGKEGIKAEIVRPIEGGEAYTTTPFKIEVQVSNEGEFGDEREPATGTTCIFGLNKKYFPGFAGCDCKDFAIKGKRKIDKENIEGENEILTFEGGEIKKGELKEFSITEKTRYDYKTLGIIKPCIKKEMHSKEGCQITSQTNIRKSVSSAPITIEKVTQDIIPETDETIELRLKIEIKKTGDGDLYDLDEDKSQCTTPPDLKKRINVRLANTPGSATCDPTELRTKKETITSEDVATAHCKIKNVRVSGEGYEPEITLILEYAYETTDSNKFEVVS